MIDYGGDGQAGLCSLRFSRRRSAQKSPKIYAHQRAAGKEGDIVPDMSHHGTTCAAMSVSGMVKETVEYAR